MNFLGSFCLLLGMALVIGMQLVVFLCAIRQSAVQAALCLLVPFYLYVYGRRQPETRKFILAWYSGLALLMIGTMLRS